MSPPKRIWRLMLPIVALAFVIGTTLGEIWHHHADTSSNACPICHVNHQAIEPPPATICTQNLVPTGAGPEPEGHTFTLSLAPRHIPARAPPA